MSSIVGADSAVGERRMHLSRVLGTTAAGVILLVYLLPLMITYSSALKHGETQIIIDWGSWRAFLPTGEIGFQNFGDIQELMNFPRYLLNSLVVMSTTVLLGLVINSMCAYSLARLKYRGRGFVIAAVVSLIIIPVRGVVVPMLLMAKVAGILDTYIVQILPFIVECYSIFLFYQFFRNLPKDMDEAAVIDGATYFGIFRRITVPLSRPVYASVVIVTSLRRWNDYLWPLMATRSERVRPINVGMAALFGSQPLQWGDIFAGAVVASLPVLIIFIALQRWFVMSVATTGLKG